MAFNYNTWGTSWSRGGNDSWGGSWGVGVVAPTVSGGAGYRYKAKPPKKRCPGCREYTQEECDDKEFEELVGMGLL